MSQQDKDLKKQAQILADYHNVFSSDAGERILKDWEEEFDECSYEKDGPIHGPIFTEGRREMYLQIKKNVEAGRDPEAWLEKQSMIMEVKDG